MIKYLILVVSPLIAIFALGISYYLYVVTRKNLNYQILVKLQMEYRSPEMLYAISTLWNFYKDDCNEDEETLMKKYGEKYDEEKGILKKVVDTYRTEIQNHIEPMEKPTDFVKTTLHHQRRLVQMFYEHLATLTTNNIIPKKFVYEIWPEETLEIIPLIIIPMAKKLAEKTDTELPDETSKLYQLYIDSKESE